MIYRIPEEIKRQLERMQAPDPTFNYKGGFQLQLDSYQLRGLQKE